MSAQSPDVVIVERGGARTTFVALSALLAPKLFEPPSPRRWRSRAVGLWSPPPARSGRRRCRVWTLSASGGREHGVRGRPRGRRQCRAALLDASDFPRTRECGAAPSGKEEDIEVGLAYFGARYYSPYLNVWLSADPATIHDLGSDSNPYAYVHGRPLVGTDPDGRNPILIGAAIGFAVGFVSAYIAESRAQGTAAFWKWQNSGSAWKNIFATAAICSVAGGVTGGISAANSGAAAGAATAGSGTSGAAAGGAAADASLGTTLQAAGTAAAKYGAYGALAGSAAGMFQNGGARGDLDFTLRGAEAGALAGAGSELGYYAGAHYPMIGGSGTATLFSGIAATNGAVGGWTRNYGITGPVGFTLDSTWGAPLTAAGLVYFAANVISGATYDKEHSEWQERHVFVNSKLTDRAGMTVGNVFATKDARPRSSLLAHETVHVWQQRVIGPAYVPVYGLWWVFGNLAGAAYGAAAGDERPWARGELWGYYYNPAEFTAYWANQDTLDRSTDKTLECAKNGGKACDD